MRPLLSRPYHLDPSPGHHARVALNFGGFVFLFLLVFTPFGLLQWGDRVPLLAMGYGAVCTSVMLLLNVGVARLLPRWFDEERWTLGRQVAWAAVNVALIGLGNALYSVGVGLAPWSFATVRDFTLFTLAVGLFPIALSVVLNESRLYHAYARRSETINEALRERERPPPSASGGLRIPAEGHAEGLQLDGEALCFVRAADNYVEVYHRKGPGVERTLLRGSLKAVEKALEQDERYLRCHKSYLVDLRKVQRVSGNAQGLKLHLEGVEEPVPVSRQLTPLVRERLAVHP